MNMIVKELSKLEYSKLLSQYPAHYSYTQGLSFAERLEKTQHKVRYFAGLDSDKKPVLSLYMFENRLMKVFKYYYSPYGLVIYSHTLPDSCVIKEFFEGVASFVRGWNVAGIKFDSFVELKQLDRQGKFAGGYDNSHFRDDLQAAGCMVPELDYCNKQTCNPRQAAVIDLVQLDNWHGFEYPDSFIVHHYSVDELYKRLPSASKRKIKASSQDFLSVRTISASELHVLTMLSGNHGGYADALPSTESIVQMKKYFRDNCQILGVQLDCSKYYQFLCDKVHTLEESSQSFTGKNLNKLKQLQDSLAKYKKLLQKYSYLESYDPVVIAGAVFIQENNQTFYWIGGTDREYESLGANYRLQWHAITQAVQKGHSFFNMLGIAGDYSAEDTANRGLIQFKQSLNARLVEYTGCAYWPVHPWLCKKLIERVPE